MTLADLPTDIACDIMSKLDAMSVQRVARTCTALAATAREYRRRHPVSPSEVPVSMLRAPDLFTAAWFLMHTAAERGWSKGVMDGLLRKASGLGILSDPLSGMHHLRMPVVANMAFRVHYDSREPTDDSRVTHFEVRFSSGYTTRGTTIDVFPGEFPDPTRAVVRRRRSGTTDPPDVLHAMSHAYPFFALLEWDST